MWCDAMLVLIHDEWPKARWNLENLSTQSTHNAIQAWMQATQVQVRVPQDVLLVRPAQNTVLISRPGGVLSAIQWHVPRARSRFASPTEVRQLASTPLTTLTTCRI